MLFVVLLCCVFTSHVFASSYRPCDGKSKLGGPCDLNADCENKGSVCLRGRCRCHAHYVEVVDDKGMNPSCQRLPSKIGAECSVKCREPLFCRNGRCQCVQRGSTSLRNGECVTVSRVGDRCSRHYDCTAPFSACLNSQCVCISGTVQQGSRCVAAANCPLGGVPSGSCVRKANVAQVHNFAPDSDDCPVTHVCITSDESPTGHCCPKVCPLGSHIDVNYSCEPTANVSNKCPSDTHYCYRISDGGFSQASCCRRPCNALAPNALYLHGDCVARGQLNSECANDSQCGGGEGMECVAGKCACMKSFHPFTDALTHPTNNPSQLCAKDCEKVTVDKHCGCH
uniref:EB domain-containing protein n=1 Tax=Steinernema glaseri TaxID=37863 RepID=A0A1I7YCC3_9BILA